MIIGLLCKIEGENMFSFKKGAKPEKSAYKLEGDMPDLINEIYEEGEFSQNGLVVLPNELSEAKERKVKKGEDFSAFNALAELLNTSVEKIKDECCLFQVRKLMSKLGQVVVRYDVSDAKIGKIIKNCLNLEVSEVLVSPAYLDACLKQTNKHKLQSQNVCAFIDFPFGESSLKGKLTDLKNTLNFGVDGATVMMPNLLLAPEKLKVFKKHVKRFGRAINRQTGVAVNATDLSEDAIKNAIKIVDKTKLSFITFVFGDTPEDQIKSKIKTIYKYKSKKEIRILGNVCSPEAVMALFKMGVDKILTPYANEIGKELVKRFKIKSVKLV